MKYNVYKILHIPSAEIHTITTSHSKNIEQFRQELEAAFIFARSPMTSSEELTTLNKKLCADINNIHLRYKLCKEGTMDGDSFFFTPDFWVYSFLTFLENQTFGKYFEGDYEWNEINIAEYELLED